MFVFIAGNIGDWEVRKHLYMYTRKEEKRRSELWFFGKTGILQGQIVELLRHEYRIVQNFDYGKMFTAKSNWTEYGASVERTLTIISSHYSAGRSSFLSRTVSQQ